MAAMTVPFAQRAGMTADEALALLHRAHYRELVRLAALLLGDTGRSEEVVQDAFVKLHLRRRGLAGIENPTAYLRTAVLNGARSELRRLAVRRRHAGRRTATVTAPSAESGAVVADEHRRVMEALRHLPERQREALALRYYLDLPEAEMAALMGVSAGSVKTHLHRGLAALAQLLEEDDR